jgi:hypothetical protein
MASSPRQTPSSDYRRIRPDQQCCGDPFINVDMQIQSSWAVRQLVSPSESTFSLLYFYFINSIETYVKLRELSLQLDLHK